MAYGYFLPKLLSGSAAAPMVTASPTGTWRTRDSGHDAMHGLLPQSHPRCYHRRGGSRDHHLLDDKLTARSSGAHAEFHARTLRALVPLKALGSVAILSPVVFAFAINRHALQHTLRDHRLRKFAVSRSRQAVEREPVHGCNFLGSGGLCIGGGYTAVNSCQRSTVQFVAQATE